MDFLIHPPCLCDHCGVQYPARLGQCQSARQASHCVAGCAAPGRL